MSPRRYRMEGRRATVEATRRRIVEGAIELHTRRGVAATSWDEIAERAGVSRATVYHHFPSLDDLVPACAQVAFDVIQVPTPEEAAAAFAALRGPRARLRHLIVETCRCYASGAGWLRAAWRERDLVGSVGSATQRLEQGLAVLLDAALEGATLPAEDRVVLDALLGFPFWDALARSGLDPNGIVNPIEALAQATLSARPPTKGRSA